MNRTRGPWTLKRNDDGYWMWEHSDGIQESPIFCVMELAMQWIASARKESSK